MKLFVSLFPVIISAVAGAQIKVCVNKVTGGITNAPPLPLVAASVKCWDEDLIDSDDAMTNVYTTVTNGCVTLTYTKKVPLWYNPCNGWDCSPGSNPDIYCIITKPGVIMTHYTPAKDQWNQDIVADFGTVFVYPERNCGPVENGCGPGFFGEQTREGIDFLTGFHEQCDNHDCCYEDCGETQESCDNEFRALMYSKCNDEWDSGTPQMSACKTSADVMYGVVHEFGGPSFAASRDLC